MMKTKNAILGAVHAAEKTSGANQYVDKNRLNKILSLCDTFDALALEVDDGMRITELSASVEHDGALAVEIQSFVIEISSIDLLASICEYADRLEFEVFDEEYVILRAIFDGVILSD